MDDKKTTIQNLKDLADTFVKERDWGKHQTNTNLAVSIAIEAAELMEHFQWGEYQWNFTKESLGEELADVINYCLYFAIKNDIDIADAVEKKFKKAAKKYPLSMF